MIRITARAWEHIECNWILRLCMACVFGLFLGTGGLYLWQQYIAAIRSPIEIMKVEALNSPIPEGHVLSIRIWRDKFRDDCPVQSQRYVTDEDGRAYDIPDLTWLGGKVAELFVDLPIDTRSLSPGSYTTHITGVYLCPGRTFVAQVSTVKFRVLPKGGKP